MSETLALYYRSCAILGLTFSVVFVSYNLADVWLKLIRRMKV